MKVHVVSKADNQEHAVATLDRPEYESHGLSTSSVRVQPLLISLTSNNLSYARGGDFLHWCDTLFPLTVFAFLIFCSCHPLSQCVLYSV